MEKELATMKVVIEEVKEKFPDFTIYITASKEFNEELAKFLGTEFYKIRLEELYGCKYQVSPFIDNGKRVVGLFDYSQILGQWNTFQDKMYKLSHLFTYYISNAKEENDEQEGSDS